MIFAAFPCGKTRHDVKRYFARHGFAVTSNLSHIDTRPRCSIDFIYSYIEYTCPHKWFHGFHVWGMIYHMPYMQHMGWTSSLEEPFGPGSPRAHLRDATWSAEIDSLPLYRHGSYHASHPWCACFLLIFVGLCVFTMFEIIRILHP